MGQFMGAWADTARLRPRADVRKIRLMIVSFPLPIGREILKGERFKQPGSFS
jgi:hypothetical protein